MALITKIRRNLWLVLILLGLALAAFIVMDMTSSQNMGGSTQFEVGQVGDETISWTEFQNAESILYAGSTGNVYARRDALWNYMVRSSIIDQETDELGITVTDDEMQELQFGNNISPVIQRNFADANGRLNVEALNNFREAYNAGNLNQQSLSFWEFQEGQVESEALQSKLNSLVVKGMYMPNWNVEKRHYENNGKIDFAYVKVPFDQIEDTEVSISDADLQAYIEENSGEYTIDEETRNVVYVAFDVVPTSQDSTDILASITELKGDLMKITEDSLFFENNYGVYENTYVKAGELSVNIMDTISTWETGTIYGPYRDGGEYVVAKLIDKKVIPDSVEVRHILRSVNDQTQLAAASQLLDSLKTVIESGASSFDTLARQFSQDPGSGAQGGDLGFTSPGRMVQPFNDLVFYRAEVGKMYIIGTQFGLHLVEVTDQKFLSEDPSYRMAYLKEAIIPSEETQNVEYDKVVEFISKNRTYAELEATVNADENLEFQFGNGLTRDAFVVGELGPEQASRDIVNWAYNQDVEPGDVSPDVYIYEDGVNYFNSKYVVAGLTAINPPGLASVATVRSEIEPKVINQKKGEKIAASISGKDLNAIASQYDISVDTAQGAVFISGFVPGVGSEPKVVGKAFALDEGASAGPIIGNSGVYFLTVTHKQLAQDPNNLSQLRKVNMSQYPTRVSNGLMDALKKMVEVSDNRSTYY